MPWHILAQALLCAGEDTPTPKDVVLASQLNLKEAIAILPGRLCSEMVHILTTQSVYVYICLHMDVWMCIYVCVFV